ncbi:energy transducer TonB, partial [Xanthomonas oryzae pv. oryzae]
MTEQLVIHRHDYDAGNQGLSWARIIGIAFVIALHLTALMMLLIPAVAPKAPAEKERTTMVTLVDAPPPPPVKNLSPPKPSPVPPPPEAPVVDVPEPRESDIVTP